MHKALVITGWLVGLSGALGGCSNPCQALCENLAEYGEECGAPWRAADVDACIDDQSSASGEDLRTCRDFGTPDRLRREWSCDDVTLYRDVGSGGGGSDTD